MKTETNIEPVHVKIDARTSPGAIEEFCDLIREKTAALPIMLISYDATLECMVITFQAEDDTIEAGDGQEEQGGHDVPVPLSDLKIKRHGNSIE